jgi:histone demethylase
LLGRNGSPGRAVASSPGRGSAGSPRLARAAAVAAANEIKKEEEGAAKEIKMCEVRISNISSIKNDASEGSSEQTKSSSDNNKVSPVEDRLKVSPDLTASKILDECERFGSGDGNIPTSLLADAPMPKRRVNLPKLTPSQLLPETPCVHVKSKQEAFSPQLLEWCLQRPITVIRGLPQVCDMDLSFYTTKSLVETHPNHPVEIRSQLEQSSDENWDPSLKEQVRSL